MINENVSFESSFNFKDISESDMQKEISNLNSKKAGMFGNIPTNVCNAVLIYEIYADI